MSDVTPPPLSAKEESVLAAATALNARVAALTFGVLGGLGLWFATALLLWKAGDSPGAHLSLLSVFLPGYEVSWRGSWIALIWGFAIGYAVGSILYRGYARTIRARLAYLAPGVDRRRSFRMPILRISGVGLGVTLGAILALQLALMTTWLVLRGTAAESVNAALLGEFLPGYRVSLAGGLIGAAQLFVIVFIISIMFSFTYNRLVDWRQSLGRTRKPGP